MITREHYFYSNGYKLKAALYLPDDFKEGQARPCIISNSGYMGLNSIYPALYARAMTARGYVAFGFDYRGFLENEGPAGVCKLEEQVEDIRNAVTYVQTLPEVGGQPIGLIGWGMAAALVIGAAAMEPAVKAVAGLNGFYNAEKWMRSVHSPEEFERMKGEIGREHSRFVREGARAFANPFVYYPLDPATEEVVQGKLYVVDGYGQEISLEFGRSLLDFNAEEFIPKLRVPVLIGHGKDNLLHPLQGAEEFYGMLPQPKQFLLLEGKHNDFMSDSHPVFLALADELDGFFQRSFACKPAGTAGNGPAA